MRLRVWALEQRTARLAPVDAAEREALADVGVSGLTVTEVKRHSVISDDAGG